MESDTMNLPHLTGVQPWFWSPNRFYRLYILPRELVCVWVGNVADMTRAEELEVNPLKQLRDDNKHNFALEVEEIESARLIKPGFWFRLAFWRINQACLLRLKPV